MLRKQEKTAKLPIIFLTAKDTENDTLTGFTLGADDYISKPFSIKEVIARVKAVLRRANEDEEVEAQVISYETLEIHTNEKKGTYRQRACKTHQKRVRNTKTLLRKSRSRIPLAKRFYLAFGKNEAFVLDRTIDVNITRLRKKIGDYGQHIVTPPWDTVTVSKYSISGRDTTSRYISFFPLCPKVLAYPKHTF